MLAEAGERAAAAERWPTGAAWIDGMYCPVQGAKISVLDLGVTRLLWPARDADCRCASTLLLFISSALWAALLVGHIWHV